MTADRGLRAALADLRAHPDQTHIETLTAACLLVANADGWVTGEERRQILLRLQGFALGAGLDLKATMAAFDALTAEFDHDPETAEARALARVRSLAGADAGHVVEIACAIAAADGGFDAAEREAAARISRALGLAPGRFGLDEAR
jgi:tellurite resistance protein TerB